jgi:glycerophosphoryl diester phosphodiesterase
MVAHRGLSGIERENTMPAFVAAGNRSYFGIETDVHRTADGHYVVMHDDWTGRIAPTVNVHIEETTFAELRAIELGDRDEMVGRIDLRIPTLEEYITVCARYEKKAVLELKGYFEPQYIGEMVEIISNLGYLDGVIFISFDLNNMIELRRILPEHKLMYLTGNCGEDVVNTLKTYHLDLDVLFYNLTSEVVADLHANGLEINCWTVDNIEDAQRLVDMGVDYITTNILE